MPIRPTQNQTEFLVNQNTSISQIARGDKGGLIAHGKADWELVGSEDGLHTPLDQGEEIAPVPADWKLHGETDIKGSWRGVNPQAADFSPSELSFAASQSSTQMRLFQSGSIDLSGFQAQPTSETKRAENALQLGLELKGPEGETFLALQAGHQSSENLTRVDASWTPQAGLETTAGTSHQNQHDEHHLGVSWEDPERLLSLSARQQLSNQPEQQMQNTQLGMKYQHISLDSTESVTRSMAGVQTEQIMDWIYSDSPLEGIDVVAGLRKQISHLLDTPGQQRLQRASASLGWSASPDWRLNLAYSEDRQPDQPDALQRRLPSLSLGLSRQLSPNSRLEMSFSDTLLQRNYGMHYQYKHEVTDFTPNERLDLDLQHQHNLADPQQDLSKFTAEYATDSFNGRPLALESKLSYATQAGTARWEGELRLYGQGSEALPLEMVATLLPDQSTRLSVNYTEEF
ncbi:MAG: hypothetical protein CVV27_16865 [Candidatus Melainabacteria bacterium HGW-Melainabacteria-1]|nr:MAG: hypothetical protein CVV27_16865 [Candidatus Melainabacteria bacterium HGW-Melainabacteria-1]